MSVADIDPSFVISIRNSTVVSLNTATGLIDHGSDDAAEVLQASIDSLPNGGGIEVRSGLYDLSKDVTLNSDVLLVGEGEHNTVFSSDTRGMLVAKDRSNVTFSNFGMVGSTGIYILGDGRDVYGFTVHNITATVSQKMSAAFVLDASGRTISDVLFYNCKAISGDAYGFLNIGVKGSSLIRDIAYVDCLALDNGLNARSHDWTVGFNLAEQVHVDNMTLINCTSNGNWESGFHFESDVRTSNVSMRDCVANNNGLAKPKPLYGSGFVLQSNTALNNCTAMNNANHSYLIVGDPCTIRMVDRNGQVLSYCDV